MNEHCGNSSKRKRTRGECHDVFLDILRGGDGGVDGEIDAQLHNSLREERFRKRGTGKGRAKHAGPPGERLPKGETRAASTREKGNQAPLKSKWRPGKKKEGSSQRTFLKKLTIELHIREKL